MKRQGQHIPRAIGAALLALMLLGGCASTEQAADPARVAAPKPALGIDAGELDAALASIAQETNTTVALSLWDGTNEIRGGTLRSLPAWSTEKVPIALAAQEHCALDRAMLDQLITNAITMSDNSSTDLLYGCLGDSMTAARLVGEQVGRSGADVYMDPMWGVTQWPISSQAHYAYYLSTLPADNLVTDSMSKVVPQQSWGLGRIEGMHFKGGWNDSELDGGYDDRQMGFFTVAGSTYGVSIGARSEAGSMTDTVKALNKMAALIVSWDSSLQFKHFDPESPPWWEEFNE
ncbi:hypothetical protein [Corynebacterium aquatimens]|uniref:Uncharacterized protein n=1 Tax=Corynebacterium aquatimens TaxID=1190508 RepID=A0A931GUC3_9CORY|nr:hypothetical protein [Corynebacterium aquatimens]MBG6122625.1 hypothetical protein [Corynebacterium aquatimens]WJY64835.1 hypothetical protein CAQUA_00435 [Corynebacterium aquatimens]